MRNIFSLFYLVFVLLSSYMLAQSIYPVNGPNDVRNTTYALTGARVVFSWDSEPVPAAVIIKNGKIVSAGKDVKIPADAVEINLDGKIIYPAFIDLYSGYGLPVPQKSPGTPGRPQYDRTTDKQSYWNEAIRPCNEAVQKFSVNEKEADELRKLGFGAVLSIYKDGIVRGTFPFLFTGEGHEVENIFVPNAAAGYSFSKGTSNQANPNSLIGAVALLRQFYYDAAWYEKNSGKEYYEALESYSKIKGKLKIFESDNWQNTLRINDVAKEFNDTYIIKGGGNEYQRIAEMKNTGFRFILPLNFPDAPDVSDIYTADAIPYSVLKHWELAPANPSYFVQQNIPFAFTLDGLKDKKLFRKNIAKSLKNGLDKKAALKALTAGPAAILGMESQIGAVQAGYIANLVVANGDIFNENTTYVETWVHGKRYKNTSVPDIDIRGTYSLTAGELKATLVIKGKMEAPEVKVENSSLSGKISLSNAVISLTLRCAKSDTVYMLKTTKLSATMLEGNGTALDGSDINWSALKTKPFEEAKPEEKAQPVSGEILYPFEAYGKKQLTVESKPLLIKNATVWTNEAEGILENTDIYLESGKIKTIGKNLTATSGATVIDASGMHVTPGIIDEHSHIAVTGGVNEGSQSSSAEVRISDAVNPEDINIYRQLSGGVTTIQQLHGSANQIGGQSSIIKLRWGKTADGLKFEGAPGFIKFALGENVKQSNWGSEVNTRYPQTRMGVEQYYYNMFTLAKEYAAAKKLGGITFRKNLELETLLEILENKRFITCHSYVQSEINMLLHVADSMGFRVNTFTHILEGYKVADKMKQHGASASSFSDWWAYKFEVYEAIPHNGALMYKTGLNVGFNSDDAEMARRLNQEAAKAVKYGGVSEEEALKFVTLNPAKMLHIDNLVGSLKAGKDADIAIWNNPPLSISARAEYTIIDGIIYFDRKENDLRTNEIAAERRRLMIKMTEAQRSGEPTVKLEKKKEIQYECETMLENYEEEIR